MDKTVAKAFKILEALAESSRPRGVTELASDLSMTKANVHRLMRTLSELGYVRQPPESNRYEPSMKLWSLGSAVVGRNELTTVALPVVRSLRDATSESVQLAVRDGDCIVYVDKADSVLPVRATTTIGSRVPIHCVSTGKAILAFSPPALAVLRFPLKRSTPATLSTRAQLLAHLEQARAAGYAVNRGEWREAVSGVAAPVRDALGDVVGAIGVWGPNERFDAARLRKLGRAVMEAAANISHRLGAAPSRARDLDTRKGITS